MGPIGEGVLGAFKGQEGFTEVTLEQILYLPSWNTAYMLKKKSPEGPVCAALQLEHFRGLE